VAPLIGFANCLRSAKANCRCKRSLRTRMYTPLEHWLSRERVIFPLTQTSSALMSRHDKVRQEDLGLGVLRPELSLPRVRNTARSSTMSYTRGHFKHRRGKQRTLPYVTFREGVPETVIPVSAASPYTHQKWGTLRYHLRVLVKSEDGALKPHQMTLPETATQHFEEAAAHGGFVTVTMSMTAEGARYWSKRADAELTVDEQGMVDRHRLR